MKKSLIIIILLAFTVLPGQAQLTEKPKNAPDEKITVKREYDKDGNLIRFDSLRVYNWSSDSAFQFPMDGGWADFFGKEFFDLRFDQKFPGDSLFSLQFPKGRMPFRFFDEEELFKGFGPDSDSSFFRNFMFHNDTSFFMGPHSSMMLPPGFFTPDRDGIRDLEQFFDRNFKSFTPKGFFDFPGDQDTEEKLTTPRQKEEWEKMMQRHQKEQEEFFKKWNQQKPAKKIEKM